jgi:hypothetical protein
MDGNIWLAGGYQGTQSTTARIVSYTPAGVLRFQGSLDGSTSGINGSGARGIAAASDGGVYVGGDAVGLIDFDPSTGTVWRALVSDYDQFGNVNRPGTFVLKLAADGSFTWVQTLAKQGFQALAARPGGGVVLAGGLPVPGKSFNAGTMLTRLETDSTPVWSVRFGSGDTVMWDLAASASMIAVGGGVGQASDVAPGPAIDLIPGGTSLLMKFAD